MRKAFFQQKCLSIFSFTNFNFSVLPPEPITRQLQTTKSFVDEQVLFFMQWSKFGQQELFQKYRRYNQGKGKGVEDLLNKKQVFTLDDGWLESEQAGCQAVPSKNIANKRPGVSICPGPVEHRAKHGQSGSLEIT